MFLLLGNSLAPTLRSYFNDSALTDSGIDLLPASIGKFKSSEAFSEIISSPKELENQPVIILQSLAAANDHSANDYAMELLLTVRTLKRNKAGPIWVIMPFIAYGRQDRPFDNRMTSVGIDDFAGMLKDSGVTGVTTVELHSLAGLRFLKKQFGKTNAFHLQPTQLFESHIRDQSSIDNISVGGPDAGANARADALRAELSADKFRISKVHVGVNDTRTTDFEGNVANKLTITVDDMIDTGGTIRNAQTLLRENGAVSCFVMAAHGLFSEDGLEKLFTAKRDNRAPLIDQIIVTDGVDNTSTIARLTSQYGRQSVESRIYVLPIGDMINQHIQRDIQTHPEMLIA